MYSLVKKYAQTGAVKISTANPNLDGTGALGTVLSTSEASGGQGIKITSLLVKATGNTSEGMVRLFVQSGTTTNLIKEVYVPATTQSPVVPAFQAVIYTNLVLDPGAALVASTQNNDTFNVIASGSSWVNCAPSPTLTVGSPQAVANTGLTTVSIPNPGLDGTGAISTLITATGSANSSGTDINTIDIKAVASTQQGMIRFFIIAPGGTGSYLFWESPVSATTQSDTLTAFRTRVVAYRSLAPGFSIGVSTQNANTFNILTFGADITNCTCP